MKKWFLAPAPPSLTPWSKKHPRELGIKYQKAIKTEKGLGGKVVLWVYGDTKEMADSMANHILTMHNLYIDRGTY